MRFKRETAGAQTDYKTCQALNQRLDEVLAALCIPRASWKLSSSQPLVLIQLRRTKLQPLARVHYSLTSANGKQVGNYNIKGHSNPRHHARGRCESGGNHSRQYGNNSSRIGKQGETCTSKHYLQIVQGCQCSLEGICKNSKDSIIELHYGKEDGNDKPPQQDHQPQQHGFPNFQPRYESQYHEDLQGIEETLSSMQFFQQTFYENMQKSQADYMEEVKQIKEKQEQIYNHNQRFHAQVWKEHEKLAKRIQEVLRGQMAQVAANNQRFEAERNLQLALERQGRDIVEIRKQVNLWTNNISSKEAYACWAQQQANPNLSEVPITQIRDIMRTNVEKGRPLFHGFLKSDYGASSSS
ncbi:hypothetical protein PIB30_092866 [Stylosanthes scabra]|uniref:Uncharacterized protein n=1 Tax=Stylosanthes scabra TaxID=79078 RepID=A0ABU6WV02_9FABA|nr:hypothetical protein [Stylosanthes scabra]